MTAIEKLALLRDLSLAIKQGDKLKVTLLRKKLGLLNKDSNEISVENLTELVLPKGGSPVELGYAVKKWLQENVLNKTIRTSDNRIVYFNSTRSVDHLTFNGRKNALIAKAVTHIVEVFSQGKPLPFEELKHSSNAFIGFRKYQKWVEIAPYRVLLEAAAGEHKDGKLYADNQLIAYNQRIVEKIKTASNAFPELSSAHLDRYFPTPSGSGNSVVTDDPITPDDIIQDSVIAGENGTAILTILSIIDTRELSE